MGQRACGKKGELYKMPNGFICKSKGIGLLKKMPKYSLLVYSYGYYGASIVSARLHPLENPSVDANKLPNGATAKR